MSVGKGYGNVGYWWVENFKRISVPLSQGQAGAGMLFYGLSFLFLELVLSYVFSNPVRLTFCSIFLADHGMYRESSGGENLD